MIFAPASVKTSGETAEASAHYDGALIEYEKQKKDAAQALTQPDKFKNNPFEKARLETLAKGPPPEYVAAAAFHGACLHYEAGRFAEALPRFQAFGKDYVGSLLQPDAALRAALTRHIADATVVIVAQRVSTIRDADRIIVLDDGRVAGTGTHADLMATNRTYREIVLSQLTEQEAAA